MALCRNAMISKTLTRQHSNDGDRLHYFGLGGEQPKPGLTQPSLDLPAFLDGVLVLCSGMSRHVSGEKHPARLEPIPQLAENRHRFPPKLNCVHRIDLVEQSELGR